MYQPTLNSGNTRWFALKQNGLNGPDSAGGAAEIKDQPINALGSSRFNYAMQSPEAVHSCSLAIGGKVSAGEVRTDLTAVDYGGNEYPPECGS